MTFKEKFEMVIKYQQVMVLTRKIYQDLKFEVRNQSFLINKEKLEKISNLYIKTKRLLHKTFIESLPEDYKLIYANIFANRKIDVKWYLKYFSKTTYYRKLGQLLDLMLFIVS